MNLERINQFPQLRKGKGGLKIIMTLNKVPYVGIIGKD